MNCCDLFFDIYDYRNCYAFGANSRDYPVTLDEFQQCGLSGYDFEKYLDLCQSVYCELLVAQHKAYNPFNSEAVNALAVFCEEHNIVSYDATDVPNALCYMRPSEPYCIFYNECHIQINKSFDEFRREFEKLLAYQYTENEYLLLRHGVEFHNVDNRDVLCKTVVTHPEKNIAVWNTIELSSLELDSLLFELKSRKSCVEAQVDKTILNLPEPEDNYGLAKRRELIAKCSDQYTEICILENIIYRMETLCEKTIEEMTLPPLNKPKIPEEVKTDTHKCKQHPNSIRHISIHRKSNYNKYQSQYVHIYQGGSCTPR